MPSFVPKSEGETEKTSKSFKTSEFCLTMCTLGQGWLNTYWLYEFLSHLGSVIFFRLVPKATEFKWQRNSWGHHAKIVLFRLSKAQLEGEREQPFFNSSFLSRAPKNQKAEAQLSYLTDIYDLCTWSNWCT